MDTTGMSGLSSRAQPGFMGYMDDTIHTVSQANMTMPPLSQQTLPPGSTMPPDSPVDQMPLLKATPKADPEEKKPKNISLVMKDTNFMIKFGIDQVKHQITIHNELKKLLEFEKKVLKQLIERSNKFTEVKEQNKKRVDEWESEHSKRMPFYCQYLTQLLEIPEGATLKQEGVPCHVQQKILYKVVGDTSHASNNAIVQLSLQNTLVNDADLSLSKLREYCELMIRQIDNWLRQVTQQGDHYLQIQERWNNLNQLTKKLKANTEKGPVSEDALKTIRERVEKLEVSVEGMRHESTRQPRQMAARRLQFPATPCSPPNLIGEGYFDTSKSPEKFPTGDQYFGMSVSPKSPPIPPLTIPTYTPLTPATPTEGRLQRSRAPPGVFPIELVDLPGMAFPIPLEALEKGGRKKGEYPKTPPSPCPPNYGRFTPVGASSPEWNIRDYEPTPDLRHPLMGQPLDPAFLPQIQEGLDKLAKRNKNLQELVANFRNMRKLLTAEMDKAVRLNQKLQRDLYYVAEEAKRQPAP